MEPEELSSRVDKIVYASQVRITNQTSKTSKALFNEMSLLLQKLELDSEGLIIQSQANRSILAKVDTYFNSAFNKSGYYDTLDEITGNVVEITDANAAYFTFVLDKYTPDKQFIKSLQKGAIAEIETLLANEGLELSLKKPIIDILNQNINTKASYVDLVQQMRTFILGDANTGPTLARYAKQITNDALFNYSRAYQEAISVGVGLEFVKYSGGTQDDSRDFCVQRANKYFHKKEVEKWASQDWTGKRKGTTSSTIFIYAGGYNCSHQIIYVSEATVPKSVLQRAKQEGYTK